MLPLAEAEIGTVAAAAACVLLASAVLVVMTSQHRSKAGGGTRIIPTPFPFWSDRAFIAFNGERALEGWKGGGIVRAGDGAGAALTQRRQVASSAAQPAAAPPPKFTCLQHAPSLHPSISCVFS